MRIDVRQNILDYEGKPLPGRDGKPEVLRTIISTALNGVLEGETMTPEDKSKAYELTTKIYARKEVDLTLDERKFIRDRVGLLYGALVFGRVSDILEQNDERERPVALEDEPTDGPPADDTDKANKPKTKVKSK